MSETTYTRLGWRVVTWQQQALPEAAYEASQLLLKEGFDRCKMKTCPEGSHRVRSRTGLTTAIKSSTWTERPPHRPAPPPPDRSSKCFCSPLHSTQHVFQAPVRCGYHPWNRCSLVTFHEMHLPWTSCPTCCSLSHLCRHTTHVLQDCMPLYQASWRA